MSAVFELKLEPGPKLLLVALADNCNDGGFGFPSRTTLARKSSVSVRTAVRYLNRLEEQGLLSRTSRRSVRGRQTSNAYQLNLSRIFSPQGDKLARGTETPPTATRSDLHGRDTDGTQTITQSSIEPPLRGSASIGQTECATDLTASPTDPYSDTAMNAAGYFAYPLGWRSDFIQVIQKLLIGVDATDAQTLIDELAERMRDGNIKHPASYFRALIKSYQSGSFLAERAHRSAARREASVKPPSDPPTRAAINREVQGVIDEFRRRRKSK